MNNKKTGTLTKRTRKFGWGYTLYHQEQHRIEPRKIGTVKDVLDSIGRDRFFMMNTDLAVYTAFFLSGRQIEANRKFWGDLNRMDSGLVDEITVEFA